MCPEEEESRLTSLGSFRAVDEEEAEREASLNADSLLLMDVLSSSLREGRES